MTQRRIFVLPPFETHKTPGGFPPIEIVKKLLAGSPFARMFGAADDAEDPDETTDAGDPGETGPFAMLSEVLAGSPFASVFGGGAREERGGDEQERHSRTEMCIVAGPDGKPWLSVPHENAEKIARLIRLKEEQRRHLHAMDELKKCFAGKAFVFAGNIGGIGKLCPGCLKQLQEDAISAWESHLTRLQENEQNSSGVEQVNLVRNIRYFRDMDSYEVLRWFVGLFGNCDDAELAKTIDSIRLNPERLREAGEVGEAAINVKVRMLGLEISRLEEDLPPDQRGFTAVPEPVKVPMDVVRAVAELCQRFAEGGGERGFFDETASLAEEHRPDLLVAGDEGVDILCKIAVIQAMINLLNEPKTTVESMADEGRSLIDSMNRVIQQQQEKRDMEAKLVSPVADLTVWVRKPLLAAKVITVADVMRLGVAGLMKIKGIKRAGVNSIRKQLSVLGLELPAKETTPAVSDDTV